MNKASNDPPSFAHLDAETFRIGMREPLLRATVVRPARTLLRNVFTGLEVVPPFPVQSIDLAEAMAEKVRTALTRRGPAIRDFFDVEFAVRHLGLRLNDPAFVNLVRRKIAAPGNGPVQMTAERRATLDRRKTTELAAVLCTENAEEFDLNETWAALMAVASSAR